MVSIWSMPHPTRSGSPMPDKEGGNRLKVCMILEGCYPYVFGGVSSWTHHYIQSFPDTEFALWCIGADSSSRGKFKYTLPDNVTEVEEVFLNDALKLQGEVRKTKKLKLTDTEKQEIVRLITHQDPDFEVLFELFQNRQMNPTTLLMSDEFLRLLIEECGKRYPFIPFANYFYNVRSMLLPDMYLMTGKIPDADLYHCTATGYSGILGSMGKWKNHVPLVVTEHGIYTREREEELIRADWVPSYMRQQWVDLFYSFSGCAYQHADKITSLFRGASQIQEDIGAPKEKLKVIPNGVNYDAFCRIQPKEDDGYVDIGAVIRIARIKDVKTLIYAFAEAKQRASNLRLYILGDVDDKEYQAECLELVRQLGVRDITFTGVVNVKEYFPKFDFTILTSISEGQPLCILESFAAGRPVVATDVGCCRELVEGYDEYGPAGYIAPPMHKELLADAIVRMSRSRAERLKMGEAGRKRAKAFYTQQKSISQYREVYREVLKERESGGNSV